MLESKFIFNQGLIGMSNDRCGITSLFIVFANLAVYFIGKYIQGEFEVDDEEILFLSWSIQVIVKEFLASIATIDWNFLRRIPIELLRF